MEICENFIYFCQCARAEAGIYVCRYVGTKRIIGGIAFY